MWKLAQRSVAPSQRVGLRCLSSGELTEESRMLPVYRSKMRLGISALRLSSVSTGTLCIGMGPSVIAFGPDNVTMMLKSAFAGTVVVMGMSCIYLFNRMTRPFVSSVQADRMDMNTLYIERLNLLGLRHTDKFNGNSDFEIERVPLLMLKHKKTKENFYLPVEIIEKLIRMKRLPSSFQNIIDGVGKDMEFPPSKTPPETAAPAPKKPLRYPPLEK